MKLSSMNLNIGMNKVSYARITKMQANSIVKKLNGTSQRFYLLPSKCRFDSYGELFCPYPVDADTDTDLDSIIRTVVVDTDTDLDSIIRTFQYYNCNNELGRSVHIYVPYTNK